MSESVRQCRAQGFALGFCSAAAFYALYKYLTAGKSSNNSKTSKTHYHQQEQEADDECNSLFYGDTQVTGGHGFPETKTVIEQIVSTLTMVHSEHRRLPFEFYKEAVESLPIVCVDIVCRRKSDAKLLVFFRRDRPAASIWWWPGGRLFRGETFFQTAQRKIRDETGNKEAKVTPLGLINVWNTFFPDSSWDEGRAAGREGTQTVNVSVFCELDDTPSPSSSSATTSAVETKAVKEWAVEEQKWITVEDALQPGAYDKYIRLNVERAQKMGFL